MGMLGSFIAELSAEGGTIPRLARRQDIVDPFKGQITINNKIRNEIKIKMLNKGKEKMRKIKMNQERDVIPLIS